MKMCSLVLELLQTSMRKLIGEYLHSFAANARAKNMHCVKYTGHETVLLLLEKTRRGQL
jgi:hypothetical protein